MFLYNFFTFFLFEIFSSLYLCPILLFIYPYCRKFNFYISFIYKKLKKYYKIIWLVIIFDKKIYNKQKIFFFKK